MSTTLMRVSSPTFSSVCRPSQLLDHVKKDSPVALSSTGRHSSSSRARSGTGRILPAGCNLHHVVTLERAPLDPLPYFLAPMRLLLKERHLIPCLPHQGLQPKNPIGIPQLPQRDVVLVEGWAEHLFIHQDQCSDLS